MIIAIDFDGTLVEDAFPRIGEAYEDMVDAVRKLKHTDHELILWTSRVEERRTEAVRWCIDHGLRFTSVNSNTPSNLSTYGTDPRKVYADVYIDDRALGYSRTDAVKFLESLLTED